MIDPVEIPVSLDTPLWSQRITLDGVEYVLRLDWNDREARWSLSLGTTDLVWLRTGLKIVAGVSLLRIGTADPRLPPGTLMAIDLKGDGPPPAFQDLGRRVKLYYFPSTSG